MKKYIKCFLCLALFGSQFSLAADYSKSQSRAIKKYGLKTDDFDLMSSEQDDFNIEAIRNVSTPIYTLSKGARLSFSDGNLVTISTVGVGAKVGKFSCKNNVKIDSGNEKGNWHECFLAKSVMEGKIEIPAGFHVQFFPGELICFGVENDTKFLGENLKAYSSYKIKNGMFVPQKEYDEYCGWRRE